MSFTVHRAERADRLAEALAGVLAEPLEDPFATEWVCVPTRGVERWLAQTLSVRLGARPGRQDGVCAGVEFPSPGRLMDAVLTPVLTVDRRQDPWAADRLVWPVLDQIEAARSEPWAGLLWSFLEGTRPDGAAARSGRRWSTARQLADLYTAYGARRPGMIAHWLAGRDVDANGRPLEPSLAWQAELWRRVRVALDRPSPAERLPEACRALIDQPDRVPLPGRVSLFGATRIEPDQLAVLDALAVHRDIHLWLTHPSPVLWDRLSAATGPDGVPARRADRTDEVVRHRLLAYLGRDARELQLCLNRLRAPRRPRHHRPAPGSAQTLLARLQQAIAQDAPPGPAADRPLLEPGDASVQLHASHGPDRQVEVLREVLLGLLADDPSLEPRDIVVMCPDIETYAPLIAGTFGLDPGPDESVGAAEHPGHRLRVRLADRSLRRVNPVLAVLDRLLALADSRLPASAVLDLAAMPPVARRFGLGSEEQDKLAELVRAAGVRWGLDAGHRQRYGLVHFGQNTWAAGLDRMLLGVAMDADHDDFIGTALPLDAVDSGDVDLVGRIAELLERVRIFAEAVSGDGADPLRPLGWWVERCRSALDELTAVPPAEAWQTAHACAELGRQLEHAGTPAGAGLSLADVRALLAEAFKGRATRANFRTGTLTMCTMLPMRSVPHRVICLLGVDDQVFPRHQAPDGDDILAAEPWIGDRDPRSEDRQLLLDALMAAQDHFVVVYAGCDPRTGVIKPPAVPIGELLDALDETARAPGNRRLRDVVTVIHTLQPHDRRNFEPDRAGSAGAASFDPAALRGARAAAAPKLDPPPLFDTHPLPPLAVPEVTLTDLTRFFAHPARGLLRTRAGLSTAREDEEPAEQIPIAPNALEIWAIGDRLLQRHLRGAPLDRLVAAEWRRGELPPRRLGRATLDPVVARVAELAAAAAPYLTGDPVTADVQVRLEDHVLTGTVPAVHGHRLITVTYSRLAAKHRLQAWIELLALTATDSAVPWEAVTLGRGGRSTLATVAPAFARLVLADVITVYQAGLRAVLPFAPRTSAEYARIRREGKSVANLIGVLQRSWDDERDETYARFWPRPVQALLAEPASAGDVRGDLGEPSRFGSLARRVWQPLLAHEELRG